MQVRLVRDRNGQVVCAVPLRQTSLDEVLVEPVLNDGEETEDVDVSAGELLDLGAFFEARGRQ